MNPDDNPLVYSTDKGRIKPSETATSIMPSAKGVRIQRQTSGRKGKGVSVITGLNLNQSELEKLAAALKKRCGCGGSVVNSTIEIQGDKREQIQQLLAVMGIESKLSGG